MKNMIRLPVFVFLLMLLVLVPPALAKGSPDKITITGPGLATPIEITDPEILHEFNPWDGNFLDKDRRIVEETPKVNVLYEVLFYSKDTSGELNLFYTFKYSPAPSSSRGEIYLPQEKDEGYVMNNETIARRSGWLYTSAEWDSFMEQLLKAHQASGNASNLSIQFAWGIGLMIFVSVSAVTLWLLRRRRQMPA